MTFGGYRDPLQVAWRQADILRRDIAAKARLDPVIFQRFVMKDEETGGAIAMAPMHREWQDLLTQHPRMVLWSATEHGKAVPLDTPIPTPAGWRTMGDLQVGDEVFDARGAACRVTFATGVQLDRSVYRVTFDDGDSVLADADHQWIAWHQGDRDRSRKRGAAEVVTRVVTTQAMLEEGIAWRAGYRWKLPIAGAAQYPARELPMHPYVLGAWLGDGTSVSGDLTFHEDDRAIFDRCVALTGGVPGKERRQARAPAVITQNIGVGVVTTALADLGLLGRKRIPAEYLTASEAQRRDLLAGLLDTDGSVGACHGGSSRVEYPSVSRPLALQVLELVRSLGLKAKLIDSKARIDGRLIGRVYRVTFTARVPVFWLPRKLAAQAIGGGSDRARARAIVSIAPVRSVPVRCIAVDSSDRSYLMGRSYTVTHNTSAISVGRVLWEIGRNPRIRVAILSDTEGLAKKIVGAISRYITSSAEYQMVFPHVRPSRKPGEGWTDKSITVERSGILRDPTVRAAGYLGAIMGSRWDLVIVDDILNWENTLTKDARDKLFRWVMATMMGRLTRSSRLYFVGTAYHPDDLMHRMAKRAGAVWHRFPGITVDGRIAWPQRYDAAYFVRKRGELTPAEFARQILCVARSDEEARFKQEWIDRALELGRGHRPAYAIDTRMLPAGSKIYTGVDLAVQSNDRSDRSAFFTLGITPQNKRQPLWIQSGKLAGPTIIDALYDHDKRYRSIQVVENNACFPPSQLVTTARGPVPIGLVVEGDEVLTHLGRYRRVLERTCREYKGPLVRVVAGGARATCTPNHAFWSRAGDLGAEGWTSARELRASEGHQVLRPGAGHAEIGEVGQVLGYDSLVYNLVVEEDHSYVVEGMAVHNSQDYILQFAKVDKRGPLPLVPYTTGRQKVHPEFGIEGIAAEMANGHWLIPNADDGDLAVEFAEWVGEILDYDPRKHTGDRLMASFFAKEGARRGLVKAESGPLDITSR